ncbi:uncharacterized protein M6G45_013491 [Spheniscus humboldti]
MEEWDIIATEYEKETEERRLELLSLRNTVRGDALREAQLKEVEEMLEREGLSEIAHSNASEQIAYLLVERTTLLEKLEIADQKLNSYSSIDRLCAAQLQVREDHPRLDFLLSEVEMKNAAKWWRSSSYCVLERQFVADGVGEVQRSVFCWFESRVLGALQEGVTTPFGQWRDQDKSWWTGSNICLDEISCRGVGTGTAWERRMAHDINQGLVGVLCSSCIGTNHLPSECWKLAWHGIIGFSWAIRTWRSRSEVVQCCVCQDVQHVEWRLPDSKSEFTNHCNNFPSLQRTSASRGLINVSHEKLQKDNALLDTEVSEFLQEREQINKLEQKHEDLCTDERMYEEEMAKVVFLEEQIKNLRDEQELLCSELLESNKKKEELEKQLKESKEEKRLLLEEIAQLKQDILTTREQGDSTLEETLRMNQGMVHRENRFLALQSSAGSLDGSVKQSLSDERFQQQEEKMQQLRQDLRRVQNLCSSAERELRYEREKNMDLQKQNLLLQQERTKVKAELKQARAKPSNATETCCSLSAQREKSQQKVKELEQELVKRFQADTPQSSLQEELAQEKSKTKLTDSIDYTEQNEDVP